MSLRIYPLSMEWGPSLATIVVSYLPLWQFFLLFVFMRYTHVHAKYNSDIVPVAKSYNVTGSSIYVTPAIAFWCIGENKNNSAVVTAQ